MFTGIIEDMATVLSIEQEGSNTHFTLECSFLSELKIDQSIAHNGVCLTVVELDTDRYRVTAIDETLKRTNLSHCKVGDKINLERCLRVNDRLDGHMVQGHVDTVGTLEKIEEQDGSWVLQISHSKGNYMTVGKGSICMNGVSLTVVDSSPTHFSVALIPYTWEHTNLHLLQVGDTVNLEFDILGKYVQQLMQNRV